jgi:RpiB/LacA/LacB family sugar-phosphate isomerase
MTRTIAIGADHAGYELKDEVGAILTAAGYEVLDLGTNGPESVDYPDFAAAVGRAVQDGRAWRGVVVCGSGAGACIAANKLTGIRAALAHDTYTAHQAVEHDDANVICMGARIIGGALAEEIVNAFVGAQFTGEERHQRRLDKVNALEANVDQEHARA